jgi:hypothetical protein
MALKDLSCSAEMRAVAVNSLSGVVEEMEEQGASSRN